MHMHNLLQTQKCSTFHLLVFNSPMLPNDHFRRKVQEVVLGHNERKGHRYSSPQGQLKGQWSEWQHFCINRVKGLRCSMHLHRPDAKTIRVLEFAAREVKIPHPDVILLRQIWPLVVVFAPLVLWLAAGHCRLTGHSRHTGSGHSRLTGHSR